MNKAPLHIHFVCSTNTSLSPLLAALFRRDLEQAGQLEAFSVSTSGTHAGNLPRPIDRKTGEVAVRNGLTLPEHHSRNLSRDELSEFDLVIVANESNFWFVKSLDPNITATKLRLLMEFSGQLGTREMPDPLFDEISYDAAFETLERVSTLMLQECLASFAIKYQR